MIQSTKKLAERIFGIEYSNLPAKSIAKAKLCLLDWVAVTVGAYASRSTELDILTNSLAPFLGQPQATVLHKGTKTDVLNAILINGTASHILDYDDVHPTGMLGHPSVTVLPVVIALGEYTGVNGKKLIEAIVAGIETECRIGEAINPTHYRAGWHSTATLGGFAASAAAAKILGLDVDKIINAFGIAGTQAFGVQQSFGTMCKPFHAGKAAQNGAQAAIYARGGFTAPREILEGPFGFGKVYSPNKFDENMITLQDKFKIDEVLYKRYASCYYTHSTISCILELCKKYQPDISAVESILVKVHPMAVQIAGKPSPKTSLEGKFSIRCCAALALKENNALESQFTDAMVNSPVIQDLMRKITIETDEKLNEFAASVTINLKDKKKYQTSVDMIAREFVVTPEEWQPVLVLKAKDLLKSMKYSERQSDKLIKMMLEMDSLSTISDLTKLISRS